VHFSAETKKVIALLETNDLELKKSRSYSQEEGIEKEEACFLKQTDLPCLLSFSIKGTT